MGRIGGATDSLGAPHVEVLELIATGTPLPAVLDAIVRLIERQAEGLLCTLLLLDREVGRLRHGAAPHLPADYVRALDGSLIGPEEGSCGSAAYRKERVVVEDIATHPYWVKYRGLAMRHGLRACWSSPIFSPAHEVLGTFAIYYREPRGPTERELEWVGIATHLASIAIMRDRAEDALRKSEARAQELARLHTVASRVSEALVRVRDPRQIYDLACRIAVENGLAVLAWVGVYNAIEDRIEPVARFGRDDGYIDAIRLGYSGERVSRGPAAQAMRTAAVAVSNDVANDPDFYWKAEALRSGLRSCAVLPLRTADATKTLLAIYGEKADFFRDEEVAVLASLADNIAFALESAENEGARRTLEEQLRQAQKMEAIGRLASGVAHDFNNILSVILGYSELIGRQLNRKEPLWADLEAIRTAGQRAANLTRQLLAFSRQQVLEPKVLDLNDSITEMESMLRRLLGADVELTTRLATHLWNVKVDPGQVQQIVMNLVVNARDAMLEGGRLAIETRNVDLREGAVGDHIDLREGALGAHDAISPGSYVVLLVTDNGTGMDAQTRSRIFEPFFTTKEIGRGTGLGLATVFGIVMQSGGRIEVDSEPGRGTTFKVYLPRAEGAASLRPSQRSAPESSGGGETILIVEDDDQVRKVARDILQPCGYHVLEASNGGEALLICEQHAATIHLLLTDVVLPRMSGRQLAERLAPIHPEMKVLFMSGYTDDAILHHGVLDSGVAFLQKPLTAGSLTRKVAEVLGG
jgi:signal transduction histidine kinase